MILTSLFLSALALLPQAAKTDPVRTRTLEVSVVQVLADGSSRRVKNGQPLDSIGRTLSLTINAASPCTAPLNSGGWPVSITPLRFVGESIQMKATWRRQTASAIPEQAVTLNLEPGRSVMVDFVPVRIAGCDVIGEGLEIGVQAKPSIEAFEATLTLLRADGSANAAVEVLDLRVREGGQTETIFSPLLATGHNSPVEISAVLRVLRVSGSKWEGELAVRVNVLGPADGPVGSTTFRVQGSLGESNTFRVGGGTSGLTIAVKMKKLGMQAIRR